MAASPKRSRRDFLRGVSAIDALANVGDRIAGELPRNEPGGGPGGASADDSESYLTRFSRHAMACEFEIILTSGQYPQGAAAAVEALDLIDDLESQLSVYRPESEVSRLNRTAAAGPVVVEEGLFGLLAEAQRIHQQTSGAFDITSAPLTRAWGFFNRQGSIPDPESLAAALAKVGGQRMLLDPAEHTVRFDGPGLEINLGAIGKGFALDRAAKRLVAQGVSDALLEGGASSVLALGARRPGPDAAGWLVGVRDPLRKNRPLGEIRLVGAALATSGTAAQFFMHEGRRLGHLIDPRTGWPAEGVYTATALAPTAAEADALATAFYILGPRGAEAYCAAHAEAAALLIVPGEREGSLELLAFGLEKDASQGPIPIFERPLAR